MRSKLRPLICATAFFLLGPVGPVRAAEPQAGWPVTPPNPTNLTIWPSRVVVEDVDQDGSAEILVGLNLLGVFIYRGDGSLMPGWPFVHNGDPVGRGMPRVGDIDGDGELEVVFNSQQLKLWAVSSQGVLKPGWPEGISPGANREDFRLADLDGDGALEIITLSGVPRVYAVSGNAEPVPGWPVTFDHDIEQYYEQHYHGGLSVGDLDFDGRSEVVVCTKLYVNDLPIPSPVFVIKADGNYREGWPLVPPGIENYFGGAIIAPSLGNLDGDNKVDIVGAINGKWVYGLQLDGSSLFEPFRADGIRSFIACADLNGDGRVEVVVPGEDLHVFDVELGCRGNV